MYLNEHDCFAANWLANLYPTATIDRRSIVDVEPKDLASFNRVHLFAGIGGWELALQLAGWPEQWPVWTGSCPCQPFSSAGKRRGFSDERHLWPEFRSLVAKCRPPIIFGEQVASPDGRVWLARVRTDMEALGYAVGAADLCAAGVSAPHIRQRLYWVGIADENRFSPWNPTTATDRHRDTTDPTGRGNTSWLDHAVSDRRKARRNNHAQHDAASQPGFGLVNSDGYHSHWWSGHLQVGWNAIEAEIVRGGRTVRAKWRIKPGLSIVAHGIPGRVGQICGAGNAIVPQLAAEFIRAVMETIEHG